MIWRQEYKPIVLGSFQLKIPPISAMDPVGKVFTVETFCGPIIVCFGFKSMGEMQIWQKLFASEGITEFAVLTVVDVWTEPLLSRLKSSIPNSSQRYFYAVSERESKLFDTIRKATSQELLPERACALYCKNGVVETGIYGPPTEDAWEQFCLVMKESR